MCVCVCVCVCMYVCLHIYIHTHMHIYIPMFTLIAGNPRDIQNPRSRNLFQPNKSTPTPKRYKKGGGTLIRLKQIP